MSFKYKNALVNVFIGIHTPLELETIVNDTRNAGFPLLHLCPRRLPSLFSGRRRSLYLFFWHFCDVSKQAPSQGIVALKAVSPDSKGEQEADADRQTADRRRLARHRSVVNTQGAGPRGASRPPSPVNPPAKPLSFTCSQPQPYHNNAFLKV